MVDRKRCFCDRFCKGAWCFYVVCLLLPILSLVLIIGWGFALLVL